MAATVTAETILAALSPQARSEYDTQLSLAQERGCLPVYDVDSVVRGIARDLARAARSQVELERLMAECRRSVAAAAARQPATSEDKAYPALDDAWQSLRSAATLLVLAQ